MVLNPSDGDPSPNARVYFDWQQTYTATATTMPDYGLDIKTFCLTPTEAATIDPTPQHLLNNSSIVTVFTWQLSASKSWKVVVSGDNETAGWLALLKRDSVRQCVKGADFFVTAHHGHTSGFCDELFKTMGRPLAIISSERAGDQSVYNYSPYASGVPLNGTTRCHLTTRSDGHIVIGMQSDLRYTINTND
jgi:beta-lactamase superfamily II metal-dependent hydrolase